VSTKIVVIKDCMYEKKLIFINPTDANKVAEQLYHCSIALDNNSIVIFHNYDSIAVDTAIEVTPDFRTGG
jgi:hypothetical protein